MVSLSKVELLQRLAEKRKSSQAPFGCQNISNLHGGFWETKHVVPWTNSACNVDADVFVLAQDWSSKEHLDNLRGRPDATEIAAAGQQASLPTNRNLKRLLQEYLGITFSATYATDVFPFIKAGRMSTPVGFDVMLSAAKDFALPQIEIISPLIVICLGRSTTYPAIAAALGHPRPLADGDQPLGPLVFQGATIYGVTHPGSWGSRNSKRMRTEWKVLRAALFRLREMRILSSSTSCPNQQYDSNSPTC